MLLKSKGEKMIENVDGTKMIRRVQNVEKTDFCDVGCGAGLFWGVFLDSNFFGESAAECEYAANFTDVQFTKDSTIQYSLQSSAKEYYFYYLIIAKLSFILPFFMLNKSNSKLKI